MSLVLSELVYESSDDDHVRMTMMLSMVIHLVTLPFPVSGGQCEVAGGQSGGGEGEPGHGPRCAAS